VNAHLVAMPLDSPLLQLAAGTNGTRCVL